MAVSCAALGELVAAVQSTDEAGNVTTYCPDALGRLKSVTEPDSTSTQYSYDLLNNATKVSTGGQTRAFEYSTLSRLAKACNPETGSADCTASPLASSGLEQFTYDPAGNTVTRTDANSAITTYSGYDGLNRPHTKSYSTGLPSVTYVYDTDTRGTLSSVSYTAPGGVLYSTTYAHDVLGRITSSRQNTGGLQFTFGYEYSLSDRLTKMTYPSGRVVKYNADSKGRVTSVQNGATNANYVSGIGYTAAGGIQSLTLGNGISETVGWNDRFQVTGLTAGTKLALSFYPCQGAALSCTSGNNGNVRAQAIGFPGFSATQTYTYDVLNRLTGASETGAGNWKETYQYANPQSNLWIDPGGASRSGLPALTLETPQAASWFTAGNQVNGWPAYSAGNVTGIGSLSRSFGYDAENRQTTALVNGLSSIYVYDGDGQRVQKTAPAMDPATGSPMPNSTVTTTYVYDAFGQLAAEASTGQTAAVGCATPTCYVTVDHLGSTRMVTDASGNVAARYDYLPFGTELLAGTGGRTVAMGYGGVADQFNPKFTGQERDAETGLDYFHARYYSAAQGRFQSADPGNAGASMESPQTWNGYAYVGNNPMTLTDPSGESWWSTLLGIGLQVLGFFTGGISNILGGVLGGVGAGVSIGGAAACGGPLGNCGGLGSVPWSEQSPLGVNVQDSGPFIFSFEGQTSQQSTGDFFRSYWSTAGFLANFITGTGPQKRYYGPQDYRTRDLVSSKGIQGVNQQIKNACLGGKREGSFSLGTPQAAKNIPYDIFHSPVGGQVGGYAGGTWKINGNVATMRITNDAGLYSFAYHALDDRNASTGPFRTIRQTFVISEPNPCAGK